MCHNCFPTHSSVAMEQTREREREGDECIFKILTAPEPLGLEAAT